jgi:hypothetical protein
MLRSEHIDTAFLQFALCAITALNVVITSLLTPQLVVHLSRCLNSTTSRAKGARSHMTFFLQLTYGNGPLCAMFQYAAKRKVFG